jgi:hypothetical protein
VVEHGKELRMESRGRGETSEGHTGHGRQMVTGEGQNADEVGHDKAMVVADVPHDGVEGRHVGGLVNHGRQRRIRHEDE